MEILPTVGQVSLQKAVELRDNKLLHQPHTNDVPLIVIINEYYTLIIVHLKSQSMAELDKISHVQRHFLKEIKS